MLIYRSDMNTAGPRSAGRPGAEFPKGADFMQQSCFCHESQTALSPAIIRAIRLCNCCGKINCLTLRLPKQKASFWQPNS
ncbi:hypothetical protein [Paracoccus sp. SSK6]|uniref:hypothetical protein n=1 Tax=Paracoccus sp. SSK6 TaxID=3143131 RepID=UPI00321B3BA8